MSSELVTHPEVERCREQVQALQREVSRLLAELTELTEVQGPTLLNRYQVALGPWELAALEAEVAYRRQLRAVEMARALRVRGQVPKRGPIEAALDEELRAWNDRVREAVSEVERARRWEASEGLSAADYAALKKLYRALVRRLHPDLNGSLTPQEQLLWHRVQEAYVAFDLESLRDLSTILGSGGGAATVSSVLEDVERERKRLQDRLEALLAELARRRQEAPFDLEPLLDDPAWVAARRRDAEQRREHFSEQREQLFLEWIALVETPHDSSLGPN